MPYNCNFYDVRRIRTFIVKVRWVMDRWLNLDKTKIYYIITRCKQLRIRQTKANGTKWWTFTWKSARFCLRILMSQLQILDLPGTNISANFYHAVSDEETKLIRSTSRSCCRRKMSWWGKWFQSKLYRHLSSRWSEEWLTDQCNVQRISSLWRSDRCPESRRFSEKTWLEKTPPIWFLSGVSSFASSHLVFV